MDAFSSNSTTFEERFPFCEAPFVFVKNEYLVAMIFLRRARRLNAGRGRSAGSESVWFSMTQLFCKRCKTRDESLGDGYIMSGSRTPSLRQDTSSVSVLALRRHDRPETHIQINILFNCVN